MPINSIRCEFCGGRVNYVVDAAAQTQKVTCKRCGSANEVGAEQLPGRVREELAEIARQDDVLEREDALAAEMAGRDTVEESLERIDATFAAARDMLSGIEQSLGMSADITEIAEQYKISDIPAVGEAARAPAEDEGEAAAPATGDSVLDLLDTQQQTKTLRFIEEAYRTCKEQGFDPQVIFTNEKNIDTLSTGIGMDQQTADALKEVIGSKGFGYLADRLLSKRQAGRS